MEKAYVTVWEPFTNNASTGVSLGHQWVYEITGGGGVSQNAALFPLQ